MSEVVKLLTPGEAYRAGIEDGIEALKFVLNAKFMGRARSRELIYELLKNELLRRAIRRIASGELQGFDTILIPVAEQAGIMLQPAEELAKAAAPGDRF